MYTCKNDINTYMISVLFIPFIILINDIYNDVYIIGYIPNNNNGI